MPSRSFRTELLSIAALLGLLTGCTAIPASIPAATLAPAATPSSQAAAPAPTLTATPLPPTVQPSRTAPPAATSTPTPAPTATQPSRPVAPVVDELLARMSLEQKVGQVMTVGFDGTALTPELSREIDELHLGGVILFERNVDTPRALAQLNADLQGAAAKSGLPGLFICIDQEGGQVARLREDKGYTEFPGAMAVAATGQPEHARRVAQAMAGELSALGINVDLAPDLDVNNNAQNPVISERSFGSDPARVAAFGTAFIAGLQGAGVLAVGKHYPGHGDTSVDSHVALPTVPHTRERLEAVEFVPFRAAMRASVAGIMSAHITFPAIDPTEGLPATLSPKIMTGLIRDEMQYDGLLMTDSLSMAALGKSGYTPPQAAAAALQAGADVLLMQNGSAEHRQAHALIVEQVKAGIIPEARLDQAVRRILTAKERFDLLQPRLVDVEEATARVGSAGARALAREIAAQSITLVRNSARLVPLAKGARTIVVETPLAPGLGKALGTTTLQVATKPSAAEIERAVAQGRAGHTVIVATADVAKNPQQAELVKALLAAKVPTVVVAMRSPYDLLSFPDAPVYLALYGVCPATLEAAAAVLTGKAQAQGTLPVTLGNG